jgi:hypothetical protein
MLRWGSFLGLILNSAQAKFIKTKEISVFKLLNLHEIHQNIRILYGVFKIISTVKAPEPANLLGLGVFVSFLGIGAATAQKTAKVRFHQNSN